VSVAIVGINHRTVALEDLEPLIVAPADLPKALADLSSRRYLDEVAVLSTCMRTEVYAVVNRFHGAMADIREFLSTWSGKPPEEFAGSLYSYFDEAAIGHLFRVSSGLDSAALGEPEVLGQVRHAWELARSEGTCGPALGAAFRHALHTGKRARTETTISEGTTSLSYAAVEMADGALGGLDGKRALVLGLGEVGEAAARAFAGAGRALPLMVANRTFATAERVAEAVGGTAVAWRDLRSALVQPDVVVCCTGGAGALLDVGNLASALAQRQERPMLLIDLAVPRNIAPEVGALPGVTLLDMDDLNAFVTERIGARWAEVPAVERIVAEELDRYTASLAARSVAPLVGDVRKRAEDVRRSEVARFQGRLPGLDDAGREAVELLTRRIVAKLLHEPTVNLKAAAGTSRGQVLADAFRELFGLEP